MLLTSLEAPRAGVLGVQGTAATLVVGASWMPPESRGENLAIHESTLIGITFSFWRMPGEHRYRRQALRSRPAPLGTYKTIQSPRRPEI